MSLLTTKALFGMAMSAVEAPQFSNRSSVPPVGLGIVALPGLPPARCSLVESMPFTQTTRLLASRRETSRLTMLLFGYQ